MVHTPFIFWVSVSANSYPHQKRLLNMLRILHLGKFFPPFAGGIENFLADLMIAQEQQGYQVAALVHDHQPQWSRFLAPIQSEKSDLTMNLFTSSLLYRVPCYGRLLYAPISPQFPFWLAKVLSQFKPHLLHLHLPNTSAFWVRWLPAARKIPWVIHWHADVITPFNKKLALAYVTAYRPLEQRLLSQAQAIIATSTPYLTSSLPLQPWLSKTQVVPLGIALTRLPVPAPHSEAIRWAESQWQPGVSRILCVGRLTYYKGHEILLQAMTQLTGGQLILIGTGELRPRLEQVIKDLNLSQRVNLLGPGSNEQLIALLNTCDMFCLPSLERTEAFGVVLLEAMRYAKPIVASAIPGSGIGWVVTDQQTGLLVPPQDSAALAKQLQLLINTPSLRYQLGQNGQRKFMQQFHIQPVARKITEVYQQALLSNLKSLKRQI